MKFTTCASILIASFMVVGQTFMVTGQAFADSSDFSWVNKCIEDNKTQGQEDSVVIAYCSCMNNKMSSVETKSISAWEQSNPKEAKECSVQAGWQG